MAAHSRWPLTTMVAQGRYYCSQFSSVFTTDDGTVPILTQCTDAQQFSVDINPERVRKFICKLPAKFSRSPDGILTAVLKILSYELCIPLHIIFKTSLDITTCPTLWKYADITPIFKKENIRKLIITVLLASYLLCVNCLNEY